MRTVLFLGLTAALLLPAAWARGENPAERAMAQHIGSQLKESGQLRNYRIGVEYSDGVAKLTGTVTSAQQREAALRLARQIEGVDHVVCKLKVPGETTTAAGIPPKLFDASEEAALASAQSGPSNVVHAYANNGAAGRMAAAQRPPMMARTNPQANPMRPMPRSNMPLPSRRMSAGQAAPGVRQASAQGVYPAGASYAGGCGPGGCAPGGMGPGAMGPGMGGAAGGAGMEAVPVGFVPHGMGRGPSYENAQMPGYAWPSYASYPNYAALTYPKQYSPTAWPYIGPFYPYPQVPLAWRKVSLEWDDGWWFLDFSDCGANH